MNSTSILLTTMAAVFVLIGTACLLVLDDRLVLGSICLVSAIVIAAMFLVKSRRPDQVANPTIEAVRESTRYSNRLLIPLGIGALSIWAAATAVSKGEHLWAGVLLALGLGASAFMFIHTIRNFRSFIAQLRRH